MQLNAFSTAMIAATIINGSLAFCTWKRRPAKGASEFFFLITAITGWSFFAIFEAATTTVFYKQLYSILTYPGITAVPVLFLIFVLRYVRFDRWITKRNVALLFILPVLTILVASTNSVHRLLWREVTLAQSPLAGIYGVYTQGPWFWINAVYCYCLVLAALIILIVNLLRSKHLYNLHSIVLIFSSIIPFMANLAYVFAPKTILGADITPVCFTLSGILLFFAIFYYKMFGLYPVEGEIIIDNLDDGVIIFNLEDKVIDVNKAFNRILGIDDIKIGVDKDVLLSRYPEMSLFCSQGNENKKKKISLVRGNERISLQIAYSPLYGKNKDNMVGSILIIRDISQEKASEQKLNETKNMLSDIIDFLPDPTLAVDVEGKVIVWNKAMEKISGIKKKDILGKGNYLYSIPFYGKARPVLLDLLLNEDIKKEKYYENIHYSDGKIMAEVHIKNEENNINNYFWSIASFLYGSNGEVVGAIESIRDITERKKIEKKLKHVSFHDSLTGLYNRAFFEEELKRLDNSRVLPISIIMTDLNGLKLVNDAFGHDNGDKLLKYAAKIIKSCCRQTDVIARWGGDEFIVMLTRTTTDQALKIIQRIKDSCDEIMELQIPLSISIGVATKENTDTDINIILKKAEDKMYRHKLLEAKSFQNQIVKSLTNTLYDRNIETESHSKRIIELSSKIGEKLKLPDDIMDDLLLHARLHDIGKVAIGEDIIKKEGELTEEEWLAIKKHSEAGYRIASLSALLAPIADYILAQHEWWNGKGYPRGLKHEKIPLISRIVAIADAYDVMVNDRPYKKAKSKQEAIEELKRFAGIQFDPELVEEFIEIIK